VSHTAQCADYPSVGELETKSVPSRCTALAALGQGGSRLET
jgi:hypothetical protein